MQAVNKEIEETRASKAMAARLAELIATIERMLPDGVCFLGALSHASCTGVEVSMRGDLMQLSRAQMATGLALLKEIKKYETTKKH